MLFLMFPGLWLAGPACAGTMVFEDGVDSLGNWTSVNGSAPSLITSGSKTPRTPYMRLGNGVSRAELGQTVTGNWTLSIKVLHENWSRSLWAGVFNAAGTQGYGILWNSSGSTSNSGQGVVSIRKFSLGAEPVWSDTGTQLTAVVSSGHAALTPPLATVELSWDAASHTLYFLVDGMPRGQITDASYGSFSRLYVRGNTNAYFDDFAFLTETPPSSAAVANAYNLVTQGGAVGDGATDNQVAITNAIAAAKSQGKALYVPPGVFRHSSTLSLNGISLFGHGYCSVLMASDANNSMVRLSGTGQSIKTCRFTSPNAVNRSASTAATAISIYGAVNYEISGVYTDRRGIISNTLASSGGLIAGNWVSNTTSDGIHLTHGAANITVSNNRVRHAGDDMIAVVSYVDDGAACSNIMITNNDVRDQRWGRGITCVGGNNVKIQNNTIHNSSAAAVLVASESSYNTQGCNGVVVSGNTIVNPCNNLSQWESVDGNAPVLVATSSTGLPVPTMQLGNGVACARLTQTVNTGSLSSWSLSFKALHTSFSRLLWLGLFDATGRQGYAAIWDSTASGQGNVAIGKFNQAAEPVWSDTATFLASALSGHTAGATTPPMADVVLSWSAAANALTLSVDGVLRAQVNDSSFSSFNRLYVRGNTNALIDDVVLTKTSGSTTEVFGDSMAERTHNAIQLSGRSGFLVTSATITGNTITTTSGNCYSGGIRLTGETSGVIVSSNTISGVPKNGMDVQGQTRNITITGNTLSNIGKMGINVDNDVTSAPGPLVIQSNQFSNIHVSGTETSTDVILVRRTSSEAGWSSINVTGNSWSNPGGYVIQRVVESGFPASLPQSITGNTPATPTGLYTPVQSP